MSVLPMRALAALSFLVLGAGCARIQRSRVVDGALTRPAAGAAAGTAAACTPATPASSRMGTATLAFPGATGGEAVMRVEGDGYKSTVRVDVGTGTVLELREGTYQLRISVSGYRSISRTVRVQCGKDESVTLLLTRT